MMSNYPPGFGSSRDLDHVEGPLTEQEASGTCPECESTNGFVVQTWRTRSITIDCSACDWGDEDEDVSRLLDLVGGELGGM